MKLSYFSKMVPILYRKKSCVVLRLVQYSCLGHPGFITFSHFMSLHANYPRTLFLSLIMSSSKTDSRMNKNFFLRSQIWIWPMITIVVLSTNSWHKLINFGMVKPFFFFKFQFLIQQTKSFKGKKPDFFFNISIVAGSILRARPLAEKKCSNWISFHASFDDLVWLKNLDRTWNSKLSIQCQT